MRPTLDWDSTTLKEMHLDAVRGRRDPVQENQQVLADYTDAEAGGDRWELWKSSNHHRAEDGEGGWHYIEYDVDGDIEDIRRLRSAYGDDQLRISLDGDRMEWGSPYVQVLYHMKNIQPHETRPYETPNRAELVERHGPDVEEVEDIKNDDGTLDYPRIISLLADHADFGSRAALFRRVQRRGSVDISTEASKRAYDLVNERRKPTRAEKKALRDYAEARGLGHYGDGDGIPEWLSEKPTRTVFHEYLQVPDVDFGDHTYEETGDSEWLPANIRTGTYGDVDELTLKQVHDRIADNLTSELSPGYYQNTPDGREYKGIELDRWKEMISLERDRPLDVDEVARYRKILFENQPGTSYEHVHDLLDVDPFGEDSIVWECIVFDSENAFESGGSTGYWWIARGVLDVSDPDHVRRPVRNSTIIADTRGWL